MGASKVKLLPHCLTDVELWNDKEIATTLTAPGTERTAVGGKIWIKIPSKTCEETSLAVLNTMRSSTGSQKGCNCSYKQ